jgi:hypothetical protein
MILIDGSEDRSPSEDWHPLERKKQIHVLSQMRGNVCAGGVERANGVKTRRSD